MIDMLTESEVYRLGEAARKVFETTGASILRRSHVSVKTLACLTVLTAVLLAGQLAAASPSWLKTAHEELPMHVTVGTAQGDFVGSTEAVIQQAIDAVAAYGGGTVELGPGTYMVYDSVRVASNVRLVGSGRDTILRKCDGFSSPVSVDADYGQRRLTVEDPSGFRVGMGVMVKDTGSDDWTDSLAKITVIQGNVVYLDRRLIGDFTTEKRCIVSCTFSPVLLHGVQNATVESLTVDGNRQHNREINGCIGGGIFLRESAACHVVNCIVRDFAGDGIDAEINQDTVIDGCEATGMTGFGIHLGSGSARPVVRNCRSIGNDGVGLFLCWRVQDGVFERNEIRGNRGEGISIGHKDTDNVFLENVISDNGSHGIYLRGEKPSNAGSRNTFRRNTIEDNTGCAAYIEPSTSDLLFEENVMRDTRSGAARTQRAGIWAEPGAERISARNNRIANHIEADLHGAIDVSDR